MADRTAADVERAASHCGLCGVALPAGAQFCPSCGERAGGAGRADGAERTDGAGRAGSAGRAGPGPLVPGFTVLEPVGQGGTSVVYLARQESLDRLVALKVIRRGVDDPKVWRDFQREARTIAQLSGHPNVVTVYTAGRTADGQPFLVTEYLDRGSLAEIIASSGPLRPSTVVDVGVAVADALGAAHDLGIVHRDVKPGNVLLDGAGHVKLADFGIARLVAAQSSTTTGLIAFTPEHVAPEILRGDAEGPWSDVYGLASTLVSALTGTPPFGASGGQRVEALLLRKLAEPPPPLSPTVPAWLAGALTRALAPDPSARPPLATLRDTLARRDAGPTVFARPEPTRSAPPPAPAAPVPTAGAPAIPTAGAPAIPTAGAPAIPTAGAPAVPTAGAPAVPRSAPAPAQRQRRRRGPIVPALVGAAVALTLASAVTWAVSQRGDPPALGAGSTTGAPAATTAAAATTATSAITTAATTTPPTAPTESTAATTATTLATTTTAAPTTTAPAPPPAGNAAISAEEATAFVHTYYGEVAAGEYETAWARLSEDYQEEGAGDFDEYVSWWESTDVEVVDVEVTDGPGKRVHCRLTMRYHTPRGVFDEVDEATLRRDNDGEIRIESFERVG